MMLIPKILNPFCRFGSQENTEEIYLGKAKGKSGKKKVFVSPKDLSRHVFLLGSGGTWKTPLVERMVEPTIAQGRGVVLVGYGFYSTGIYSAIFELIEKYQRLDDFFLVDFTRPSESNSINPLLYGDAESLTEMMKFFLLEKDGYWPYAATKFIRMLLTVLVWRRDHDEYGNYKPFCRPFSFQDLKQYFKIESLVDLARQVKEGKIPLEEEGKPVGRRVLEFFSDLGVEGEDLFKEKSIIDTWRATQIGQAELVWDFAFEFFCEKLASIFCRNPEVDMYNVLHNGRIVFFVLPSKEETIAQRLGKLVLAMLVLALQEGFNNCLFFKKKFGRPKAPLSSPIPHLCILDQYETYAVEGFSTVLPQFRAFNWGIVLSVRDFGQFVGKLPEDEMEAIFANTRTKMLLKTENSSVLDVSMYDYYLAKKENKICRRKIFDFRDLLTLSLDQMYFIRDNEVTKVQLELDKEDKK